MTFPIAFMIWCMTPSRTVFLTLRELHFDFEAEFGREDYKQLRWTNVSEEHTVVKSSIWRHPVTDQAFPCLIQVEQKRRRYWRFLILDLWNGKTIFESPDVAVLDSSAEIYDFVAQGSFLTVMIRLAGVRHSFRYNYQFLAEDCRKAMKMFRRKRKVQR